MISVIVPVYNQQRYLDRCIKSILSQSYRYIEVILVDDGSTDSSGEICDYYKKIDNRILVIHKKNGGLSDARNEGIRHAKGEYLCFIDSDDFVDSRMLEILYGNLVKYNADISIANLWWINENDVIQTDKEKERVEAYKREEIDWLLLENDFEYRWSIVIACNKLFRRKLFENCSFEVGKIHEDEFFIHHILNKADVLTYSNIKTYYYMKHCESITGRASDKRIYDAIDAYNDRLTFWIQKEKHELVRRLVEQLMTIYRGMYYELDYGELKDGNAVKRYIRRFYRKIVLLNWKYKNITFGEALRNYLWGMNPYLIEVYDTKIDKRRKE